VAEVLQQIHQPADAAMIPAFFLDLRHAAQRTSSGEPRSRRLHSTSDVFPSQLFQMKRQLPS
jgi:hypothetical protein